jgi:hypothetical protein
MDRCLIERGSKLLNNFRLTAQWGNGGVDGLDENTLTVKLRKLGIDHLKVGVVAGTEAAYLFQALCIQQDPT